MNPILIKAATVALGFAQLLQPAQASNAEQQPTQEQATLQKIVATCKAESKQDNISANERSNYLSFCINYNLEDNNLKSLTETEMALLLAEEK